MGGVNRRGDSPEYAFIFFASPSEGYHKARDTVASFPLSWQPYGGTWTARLFSCAALTITPYELFRITLLAL